MRVVMFVVIAALFISGCASVDDYYQSVKKDAASFSDTALIEAEWYQCYGASVGSIRRKYANDPVKLGAWQQLCGGVGSTIFTEPEPYDYTRY